MIVMNKQLIINIFIYIIIYDQFKKETGSSYASFNRALDKLEFVRLIDTKYTGKGVRNSREIILRFNPDEYII